MIERGLPTQRRKKAVEALLADGWKWDGEQWIRPTAAPRHEYCEECYDRIEPYTPAPVDGDA